MDENRFFELETRIAYQDRTIAELDSIVIDLRRQVDLLSSRFAQIEEQVRSAGASHIRPLDEESPPPHY